MICKICKKEYHHCTACTFDDWEDYRDYEYCSEECFEKSSDCLKVRTLTLNFYHLLDLNQKKSFWKLINLVFLQLNKPKFFKYVFLYVLDEEEDRPNIKKGDKQ
jgi:hypothetical protein